MVIAFRTSPPNGETTADTACGMKQKSASWERVRHSQLTRSPITKSGLAQSISANTSVMSGLDKSSRREKWSSFTELTLSVYDLYYRSLASTRSHRRINLLGHGGKPEIVSSIGIKRSETRRLFAEIVERRVELLEGV